MVGMGMGAWQGVTSVRLCVHVPARGRRQSGGGRACLPAPAARAGSALIAPIPCQMRNGHSCTGACSLPHKLLGAWGRRPPLMLPLATPNASGGGPNTHKNPIPAPGGPIELASSMLRPKAPKTQRTNFATSSFRRPRQPRASSTPALAWRSRLVQQTRHGSPLRRRRPGPAVRPLRRAGPDFPALPGQDRNSR